MAEITIEQRWQEEKDKKMNRRKARKRAEKNSRKRKLQESYKKKDIRKKARGFIINR